MASATTRLPVLLTVCALVSGFTAAASATTVVPITFEELVDSSHEIFIGEVVSRQSRWVDTREGRAIVTLVTFKIDEGLKGGLQTQTSLEFLGGTVGDVTLEVTGMPEFHVGDRDVVFVGSRSAISPLVGFMYGRFRIARDPERGNIDTVRMYDGRALVTISALGRPQTQSLRAVPSLALADFRAQVVSRVRLTGGAR
jgi:hypothetical protein